MKDLCLLIIFDASRSAVNLFSFFIDSEISKRSSVVPRVAEHTITILCFFDIRLRCLDITWTSFAVEIDVPSYLITSLNSKYLNQLIFKCFNFPRVEPGKSEFCRYLQP